MKKIYKNNHIKRKIRKIETNKVDLKDFYLTDEQYDSLDVYDKVLLTIFYRSILENNLNLKKSQVDIFEKRVQDFIKKDLDIIEGEEFHDLIQYGIQVQLKNELKDICKNIMDI